MQITSLSLKLLYHREYDYAFLPRCGLGKKKECDIVYSGASLYITYADYFVYNIYFYMQSNQRSSEVSTVPWGQKNCVIQSKKMVCGCYWICHPIGGVSTKRGCLSLPTTFPGGTSH